MGLKRNVTNRILARYSLTCPREPTTHTKCNVVKILTNKTLQRWKTEYNSYFDIVADTCY